jgi:hypothetical protein
LRQFLPRADELSRVKAVIATHLRAQHADANKQSSRNKHKDRIKKERQAGTNIKAQNQQSASLNQSRDRKSYR